MQPHPLPKVSQAQSLAQFLIVFPLKPLKLGFRGPHGCQYYCLLSSCKDGVLSPSNNNNCFLV